jgi:hypothetical protein
MARIDQRRSIPTSQPAPAARPSESVAPAQPAADPRSVAASSVAADRMVGASAPATPATSAESVADTHAAARSRRADRGAAAAARRPVGVNVYPDDPVVDVTTVRREAPGRWFDRDSQGLPVPGPAGDRTSIQEDGTLILNLPNTDPRAKDFPEYLFGGDELTEYKMDFPLAKPNAKGDFTDLKPGSVEQDQLLAHYYVHDTLDTVEKYLGRKVEFDSPDGRITIKPHAGVGLNAFFNPNDKTLNFLMFMDKQGQLQSTARASDIAEHEFGHAINDALRPKMWEGLSNYYEYVNRFGWSEGEADRTSLIQTLSDPDVRKKMLQETGGDLSRKNVATQLGETMGKALHDFGYTDEDAVRSFINPLNKDDLDKKLADWLAANPNGPDPKDPTPVILGYQMGQTLATATYDLVKSMYDKKVADNLKPGMTPEQKLAVQDKALAEASETVGRLVGKAKDFDPMTGRYYKLEKAAQSMIKADRLINGGANEAAITKAFEDRKLLTPLDKLDLQQELPQVDGLKIEHDTKPEKAIEQAQKWLDKNHDALGLPSGRNSDFVVNVAQPDAFGNTIVNVRQALKDFDQFSPALGADAFQNMGAVGLVFDAQGKMVNLDKDSVLTDQDVDVLRGDLTKLDIQARQQAGESSGTEYLAQKLFGGFGAAAKTRMLDVVQGAMRDQLTAAGFKLDQLPAQLVRDYVPQSADDVKIKYDVQHDATGAPHVVVQAQFATKQGAFLVQQRLEDAVAGKKNYEFRSLTGHVDGPARREGQAQV